MPRFEFRLEKLLQYRITLEKKAKDEFLETRAKVLEAENALSSMERERLHRLETQTKTLRERVVLDSFLQRREDDERAQAALISVLKQEEESARLEWMETKKDVESLEKLREKAVEEWTLAESRREQADLDEWTSSRRAA